MFNNREKQMTLNIGESVFYEKINVKKLNYIINNRAKYEAIITEQEKEMRRTDKNYNAYAVFQKIKENVFIPNELRDTDYGYLKITYKKGTKSNNIGRWYCNKGIGIQPLCVSVRHTICDGLWTDIDQVNSHPTILKNFINKFQLKSPLLNECMENREAFLAKVMKEEKCSRGEAKTLVIATINGKRYKSKTLVKLADELKPIIQYIIDLDEYKEIKDYVVETYKDDKNIAGKTISRILQVIENDLLETYVEFFINQGLITKYNDGYEVALIFDGLQLRLNDKINDELLNECRKYSMEKTGYDIELKVKPFDSLLDLPENIDINDDDDLTALIDKYEFGLNTYVETLKTEISDSLSTDGSNASISTITKKIFKDTIVYDESCSLWFYCNIKNIWTKSKTAFVYKGLLKSVIYKLFLKVAQHYCSLSSNSNDEAQKELYTKKSATAIKIANKLLNASYLDAVVKIAVIDFNKSQFFETKIDSNGYLFAFKNKVLDCRTLEIRDIRPLDYIMLNTGYDYPEYIDEDLKGTIEDYYTTIYPDAEVREYMWNNDAFILNGERPFASFNIHTGGGANSKSTKMNMIDKALGEYYCRINPETFTKPPKSSNSTSELIKTKGKRCIGVNEPNNDSDNKLQINILKEIADGYKGLITTRGLYQENISFKPFFQFNMCCNNKPQLSSIDGGIVRRLRIVDYPVKFVENPDAKNKFEAKLDLRMGDLLNSNEVRNTYIRMLIDRFINIASKLTSEIIPAKVQQENDDYVADCDEVLAFINENYTITNVDKDRYTPSELYNEFKRKNHGTKMTTIQFRADILKIGGITYKKSGSCRYYCGLKQKEGQE